MKKPLFFICILTFLAMTITSCEKSAENGHEPKQPEVVLPNDYIHTCWRLDSIKSEVGMPCPGAVIYMSSDSIVIINGDSIAYEYKDSTYICHGTTYTVLTAKQNYAILSDGTTDYYVSKFPFIDLSQELSSNDPNNIVGQWKLLCYYNMISTSEAILQEKIYKHMRTNPGVEMWNFQKDGNATYYNYLTCVGQMGKWEHKPGYMDGSYSYPGSINFVNNPAGEDQSLYIEILTNEWMILMIENEKSIQRWDFVRVE